MYRIAIVDDEETAVATLQEQLRRYEEEHRQRFEISVYKNAIIFLTNYQPQFDLIFIDIQMPYMDGIKAAEQIRKLDIETMLVFVTNMAQMAAVGYQVQAFDFLVKPLCYDMLALKLKRILEVISIRHEKKVTFSSQGTMMCLPATAIYYVEISDHQLIYHTKTGDHKAYGTLKSVQKQMEGMGFFLCNNCFLVNLEHVQRVFKYTVTVHGVDLPISHPRRKVFLEALNDYIGG